jgi:hypothetical protein
MPKLQYVPTSDDPLRVRELAAIGVSQDDIAAQLGLTPRKLNKLFPVELKKGAAEGRERAIRTLHGLAMSGNNSVLLTFWVKAQCGWRDTGTVQSLLKVAREVLCFHPATAPKQEPSLDNPPLP